MIAIYSNFFFCIMGATLLRINVPAHKILVPFQNPTGTSIEVLYDETIMFSGIHYYLQIIIWYIVEELWIFWKYLEIKKGWSIKCKYILATY